MQLLRHHLCASASLLLAVIGLAACRFLHIFGSLDATAAISEELGQANPVAWAFMICFGGMILLSLLDQVRRKCWLHCLVLFVAFLAVVVVGFTNHQGLAHNRSLIVAICALWMSVAIHGLGRNLLEAVTFSLLAGIVIAVLLLSLTAEMQRNPGNTEKGAFTIFAVVNVYFQFFPSARTD